MVKMLVVSAALLACGLQAATAADLRVPQSVVRQYMRNQQMPPPVLYPQAMYQPYQPPVGCAAPVQGVVSAAFNSAVCAALLPFNVGQMMVTGAATTVYGFGIGR